MAVLRGCLGRARDPVSTPPSWGTATIFTATDAKSPTSPITRAIIAIEKKFIDSNSPTVFHYTSISAFVEILQARKLRASRSEFLNDATEFRYGQQIVAQQALKFDSSPSYSKFSEAMTRALSVPVEAPFVACFCKNGDLLSQWRAYSSHGQGICIGFSAQLLSKVKGARVHNVIYDESVQAELVHSNMKLLADTYAAVGLDLSEPENFTEFVGYIGIIDRHCALIKHSAFSEEGEVRAVVPDFNVKGHSYEIKFRTQNRLIVPFIELDFSSEWPDVITEVIVGPGPDRDVRKMNVEHFLKLQNLSVPVKFSNCQFR